MSAKNAQPARVGRSVRGGCSQRGSREPTSRPRRRLASRASHAGERPGAPRTGGRRDRRERAPFAAPSGRTRASERDGRAVENLAQDPLGLLGASRRRTVRGDAHAVAEHVEGEIAHVVGYQSDQNPETAARRIAMIGSASPDQIVAESLDYATANNFSQNEILLLQGLLTAMQTYQPQPVNAP